MQSAEEAAEELWFELLMARTLGCTVRELRDRMDCEEWAVWKAAYAALPWGDRRDDWRMDMVMTALANFSGGLERPRAYPKLVEKKGRGGRGGGKGLQRTRLEDHLRVERQFAALAGVVRAAPAKEAARLKE